MGGAATYCWEGNPDPRRLERPVKQKPFKRRYVLKKKIENLHGL